MTADSPEQLFLRYRERGDGRALAELYDLTAPEVLRVALFLARDAADAEDLVQASYLGAIEAAGNFDPSRRFLPWLLGILANQARRKARRDARGLDPLRIAAVPGPDPLGAAQGAEFNEQVDTAIASLPEIYRPVLLLHLKHGLAAADIAHALQRPPATIRSQLVRGIELLKNAMPRGLALSAFLLLTPARSLSAIKAIVLAKAAALAVVEPGVAASFAGGLVMKKVVVGGMLAVFAGVAWFAWPREEPEPQHEVALTVAKPDAAPPGVAAKATAPSPEAVRTEVLPEPPRAATPTGSLLLRVTWATDGSPAASVRARLIAAAWPNPRANAIDVLTDAHGEALVAALPPGTLDVGLDRCRGAAVEILAGEQAQCALAIPASVQLEVTVVDADSAPVPWARIWLSEPGSWSEGREVGIADGAGRCTLRDVGVGRAVVARADGHCPSAGSLQWIEGRPGEHVAVRIQLGGAGGAVEGTVENADGSPCANAIVRIGDLPMLVDPERPGKAPPPPSFELRADEYGRFRASGLPPCETHVAARAPGTGAQRQAVTIRARETSGVVLRLPAGARISGRLVDDTGAPVAAAELLCAPDGFPFAACATRSAKDGSYELVDVAPGNQVVDAQRALLLSARQVVAVAAGAAVRCDLVLPRSQGEDQIRGRVVDDGGQPLAGWTVECEPTARSRQPRARAATDAEGRFVHENCRNTEYRVLLLPPDAGPLGFPVLVRAGVRPGGDELLLSVPASCRAVGSIAGVILGPDRQPVARATVRITDLEHGLGRSLPTAADGSFEASTLPARDYQVSVNATGLPPRALGRQTVRGGERIDLGAIELRSGGTVRVVLAGVKLESGREPPVAFVLDAHGHQASVFLFAQASAESMPLDAGRYRLQLIGAGWATARREFEIVAGQVATLEVAPERGVACLLQFTVADDGRPWRRFDTWIVDASGAEVWEMRGLERRDDRMPELNALLGPGHYRCFAKSDSGHTASAELLVANVLESPAPLQVAMR